MAVVNQDFRDGFLFVADDQALDFVNTRPVRDGHATELLTDLPALIRWFLAAGLLEEQRAAEFIADYRDRPEGQAVLQKIVRLRESLREQVISVESDGRIGNDLLDELNGWLSDHPVRMKLVRQKRKLVTRLDPAPVKLEELVGMIVNLAAVMFSTRNLGRIRRCDSCILYFYDRTKSHTRRWCSMRLCGNRAKVAAYVARKRERNGAR